MDRHDFCNRWPGMIGEGNFSQYAVLAALVETDQGPALLFEKRSEVLDRQPGEICLPGGKLEPDEKPVEAAVRETMEELLLNREQIEVLGPGDIYVSPFNIIIHPFIAKIKDYKYSYNREEVASVFTVPLHFFLKHQPSRYFNQLVHEFPNDFPYESIPGGKNYPFSKGKYEISFYKYEEEVIWGMTACMVESIVELISRYNLIPEH